jgi:hypothetical protein
MKGLLAVALLTLLGACATEAPMTIPVGPMPDLKGIWKGTWGGTPLTLIIVEQRDASPVGGVVVGPWHLSGQELWGVAGVLTFAVRGDAVSVNVQGHLGDLNGRLTLILEPITVHGGRMRLTRVGPHRLVGEGISAMRWEPQGPVELLR